MPEKDYTMAELDAIALEVIDMLRPKHLRICEVKNVLQLAMMKIECVVLREKAE